MPKRIIIFLVGLIAIAAWFIYAPKLNHQQTSRSIHYSASSTHPEGYQGFFKLTKSFHPKSVDFWQHSLMKLSEDKPKTVIFIEPGQQLFYEGETYVNHLRTLVYKGGYHFIFILNPHREWDDGRNSAESALSYINYWFTQSLNKLEAKTNHRIFLSTFSLFPSRQIQRLYYNPAPPLLNKLKQSPIGEKINTSDPSKLWIFRKDGIFGSWDPLLYMKDFKRNPLALTLNQGKGKVTIVLNSYLFNNFHLAKAHNAPLAIALTEQDKDNPILFDGYSHGFRDNHDLLTHLASGQQRIFLFSILLLLGLFIWWLLAKINKNTLSITTPPELFKQTTFVDALADRYLETKQWHYLYEKQLHHFTRQLEIQWPGYTESERLKAIAENPFIEVSLIELESLFHTKQISSEAMFVKHSRQLIKIQKRVFRHDNSGQYSKPYSTTQNPR